MSRSERRSNNERLLKKWLRLFRCLHIFQLSDEDELHKQSRKKVETRKPCSCWMCSGHKRYEKTIQEQRADLDFKEQREELQ